ncbi:carbon-nitrogen hydrolase family protein, partial [bacterium]|nr:carbon-nitrogen hydrolase family protein [bacterium]
MTAPNRMLSAACVAAALALCGAKAMSQEQNLVRNPTFARKGEARLLEHWTAWAPDVAAAACAARATDGGLLFEAPGRPYAVGGVAQDVGGIRGGSAYAVEVACAVEGVPSVHRSVLVRVSWTRGGKLVHPAGMYVRGPVAEKGAMAFRDVLVAPKEADGARLSLEVKWPQGGSVLWQRASLLPAAMPKPRKVKLGSVFLRPTNSTREKNLDLWCQQIDAAGKLGLDAVCLCEAITSVGTRQTAADDARPIPGPDTERLGAAARRNKLYVVAGLAERDGDAIYNTAVLLDREGRLAGKYRKVHLPREEWKKGITPGHEYPVFRTDFGTVAIQICYDWFFSEPERLFALRGAEVLFAPTWGNTLPDEGGRVDGETT